jgi:hypothetical protein
VWSPKSTNKASLSTDSRHWGALPRGCRHDGSVRVRGSGDVAVYLSRRRTVGAVRRGCQGASGKRPAPPTAGSDAAAALCRRRLRREPGPVHAGSRAAAKVAFLANIFAAWPVLCALRWEHARTGRAGWVPAVRGGWRKCVPAAEGEYLPLTEEVITAHLSGELELVLNPVLDGDRCQWLASEFDGPAAVAGCAGLPEAGPRGRVSTAWRCSLRTGRARLAVLHRARPRGHRPESRQRSTT